MSDFAILFRILVLDKNFTIFSWFEEVNFSLFLENRNSPPHLSLDELMIRLEGHNRQVVIMWEVSRRQLLAREIKLEVEIKG